MSDNTNSETKPKMNAKANSNSNTEPSTQSSTDAQTDKKTISRRGFVAGAAAAPALFHIVPIHCLGGPKRWTTSGFGGINPPRVIWKQNQEAGLRGNQINSS